MRRYHSVKDTFKRLKRRKIAKRFGYGFSKEKNFNKNHPFDCGNKRCYICHTGKVLKEKTSRDVKEEERFKNMVYEYFNHDTSHYDWIEWSMNFYEE